MRRVPWWLLGGPLLGAFALHWSMDACAQERPSGYPVRPIRIVLASVPGGALDMVCRTIGQMLGDAWGQTVVIDNRPGGGTVIATEIAAKAPADGYNFLAATDTLPILSATRRVAFDVRTAFDPVVAMTAQPYILMLNAGVPARTVKELVAHSMTQTVSYGSSGVGTAGHLGLERLAAMTGGKFLHVPYKGGAQALVAAVSGEIQMYPGVVISATQAMKAGKVRALATMSLKRVPALPDLPTVAEQGYPGFKLVNSYNLYAPAGTPRPITAAVNRAIGDFVYSPKMTQRLVSDGSQPPDERMTPEQFRRYLGKEYEEVERQVKHLGVKLY